MTRLTIILLCTFFVASPAVGERSPDEKKINAVVDAAIRRGVDFMLSQQKKDGAIHDNRYHNTMTALSIMSLSAVGHQPTDDTREGRAMKRALDYILKPERQEKDGYYGRKDNSRMYGHGIVTLMLAEMLGMGVNDEQDKVIRERLTKAVDLILRAQQVKKDSRYKGGWRYEPTTKDADLSVSAWQLISLRAAKNAGLKVPKESIELAVDYMKRSMGDHNQKKVKNSDYFRYQPYSGGFRFGSASAGLLVMQICGQYEAPQVAAAANHLVNVKIEKGLDHFYYGIYYYSQGMFQMKGKFAEHAKKVVPEVLSKLQQKDGSWNGSHGKVYCTAMSLLSLSIYHHYLPIYQR